MIWRGWPLALSLALVACSSGERRFPLRDPMTRDTDLVSRYAKCRRDPKPDAPAHVACTPKPFVSSLYWDGTDNMLFRPLSETLGLVEHGEAINANSLDEVPDSAWFTNRIATITPEQLALGACKPEQMLDPDAFADGTWVIDKGNLEGSTPGFRIIVPGKGKYLIKVEDASDEPERQSAAAVIGAAAYFAAGYYAACEQILWARPSIFKLTPGLHSRANFQQERPFDQARVDDMFAKSPKRDGKLRMSASAWLPGYALGPYRNSGTRDDDPNDVIPHEDRRELRGMRLLAAWLGRTDTREANALDTWLADDKKHPDSSPGKVIHYQLDQSETLGGDWPWAPAELNRRIGQTYLIDWADVAHDLFDLGAEVRSWEKLTPVRGHEIFGYYQLESFDAEHWKNEYPIAPFGRMTERDGAWMARILAQLTPEMVHTLAVRGDFTDREQAKYLERVMEGRLVRTLERYLLRLSPIGDAHVEGGSLCAVDFAERRGLRDPSRFVYTASTGVTSLAVAREARGRICIALRHTAESYFRVTIDDGVARGRLVAHFYDLGDRGFKLVGLERPAP